MAFRGKDTAIAQLSPGRLALGTRRYALAASGALTRVLVGVGTKVSIHRIHPIDEISK